MKQLLLIIFVLNLLLIQQNFAKNCEIPDKQEYVTLSDPKLKCTSFHLKPTGNYTTLIQLYIVEQKSAKKEAFYDLFDQLKIVPFLWGISLQGNTIEDDFDMAKLANLSKLSVFSARNHNISEIVNSEKHVMPSITYIDFFGNKIHNLGPIFFNSFPNMATIELSSNRISGQLDLQKFDQFEKLDILNMADNGITEVIYSGTNENSTLSDLDLSRNYFENVDFGIFKRYKNLEYLELHSNGFSDIFDIDNLQSLKNLKQFSIGNQIWKIVNSTRMKMPSITHVNFSNNKLIFIDLNYLGNFENLQWLNLRWNQLVSFRSNLPNNLKKLEYLDFSMNKFSGTFDLGKLEPLPSLKKFNIDNNEISRIVNSAKSNMPSVSQIDFKKNKLTFIDLKDFKSFENLQELQFEGNQLVSISYYEYAKLVLPQIEKISMEQNDFFCFQLEKMLAPYKGTEFWYWSPETLCLGQKNILFEKSVCCYLKNS